MYSNSLTQTCGSICILQKKLYKIYRLCYKRLCVVCLLCFFLFLFWFFKGFTLCFISHIMLYSTSAGKWKEKLVFFFCFLFFFFLNHTCVCWNLDQDWLPNYLWCHKVVKHFLWVDWNSDFKNLLKSDFQLTQRNFYWAQTFNRRNKKKKNFDWRGTLR